MWDSHCHGHFYQVTCRKLGRYFRCLATAEPSKVSFLPQVKDADLGGAEGPRRSRLAHEAGQPGILRWASLPVSSAHALKCCLQCCGSGMFIPDLGPNYLNRFYYLFFKAFIEHIEPNTHILCPILICLECPLMEVEKYREPLPKFSFRIGLLPGSGLHWAENLDLNPPEKEWHRQGCGSGSALFLEAGSGSAFEWKAGSDYASQLKFRSFRGSIWSLVGL